MTHSEDVNTQERKEGQVECPACGGTGCDTDSINPVTMTFGDCLVCHGHGVVAKASETALGSPSSSGMGQ